MIDLPKWRKPFPCRLRRRFLTSGSWRCSWGWSQRRTWTPGPDLLSSSTSEIYDDFIIAWPRGKTKRKSSFGILTGDTCCTPGQLSSRQFVQFAIALVSKGIEGETSHSLLTWPMTQLSPNWGQPCSQGYHKKGKRRKERLTSAGIWTFNTQNRRQKSYVTLLEKIYTSINLKIKLLPSLCLLALVPSGAYAIKLHRSVIPVEFIQAGGFFKKTSNCVFTSTFQLN